MNRPHRVLCALAVASLLVASTAEGQVLYSENFNNGTAASRWSVSQIGGTNAADFAFDYSNSTFTTGSIQ